MKRVVVALFVLLAMGTVSLFAAPGPGTKRVVFIARAQGDAFAAWLANSIKAEAKKYPYMKLDVMDGQANDDHLNGLIETAITSKYDLIILQCNNGVAQTPYIKEVVAAGIPIILTNPRVLGMQGVNTVDADPYEQGAVNARYGLKLIPQNAKVVVLDGPAGNFHSDNRRRAWQKEFFDKRPDVTIVGEQIANWNKAEAMPFMEDWVQATDHIDALISMNDDMCTGALEVVKDNPKYKNLLAFGVDGTVEAALAIRSGRMTTTSFQNAYELAKRNMFVADQILTGKAQGLVDTNIDCPLITKANVNQLIDAHRAAGRKIE